MAREIIYKAMLQKYEAEIADADVKIQILLTTARIIPEHIDITGEIDKLLGKIEAAESKMAILKRKYGINQAKICDTWGVAEGSQRGRRGVAFFEQNKNIGHLTQNELILRHLNDFCEGVPTGCRGGADPPDFVNLVNVFNAYREYTVILRHLKYFFIFQRI